MTPKVLKKNRCKKAYLTGYILRKIKLRTKQDEQRKHYSLFWQRFFTNEKGYS